ncbi:hypothetical protein EGW08_006171 [Elysia chlorotica]|uniref:THUMP domain-containing protein n=1 Tax=Elysia chlorotica TaxID=188477 RepID=A0A3S1BQ63_ELYCH|nr:hypothetical protein EGW08_006171 [Elysia chlorotica]
MASAGDGFDNLSKTSENEESCTIEASVVTGFEECARGEAREKFGTEVKTSRGKIIWNLPLSRLPEVLKMSSIDNCRVVMHTDPHFKFTEQNDSLARIQKMILDVDWDTGLKAWRQLFDFPYPVASRPDVIPSPEDLVDVVVMTKLPQPKDKSEKKNKNKGKGKGKKKDRNQTQIESKEDDGGGKVPEQKDVPGINYGAGDHEGLIEKSGAYITEDIEKSTKLDKVLGGGDLVDLKFVKSDKDNCEAVDEETGPKLEEKDKSYLNIEKDIPEGDCVDYAKVTELNEDKGCGSASSECTKDSSIAEQRKQHVAPPKTVIIKKITSAELLPKIDIKVLDPNVFPTALESEELRHLEPMEVDSPNASFNKKWSSVSPEKVQNGTEKNEVSAIDSSSEVAKSEKPASNNVDNSDLSLNVSNAAAAFATSVINRLSSPPTSPARENQASTTCTTPPPTPIASKENPFLAEKSSPREQPTDAQDPKSVDLSQATSDCGSSVDPIHYNSDASLVEPSFQPAVVSESPIPKSNVTETSAIEDANQTETLDAEHCKEIDVDKKKTQKLSGAEPDPTKPKFRVTCNRVGEHPFDSSSAAASFGSAVITYFKWPVDLKKFDIEVLLNIDNEEVSVSIGLTRASLHNRNMVAFGPTTLRPTICYNMLRLCRIKNGDFICDPMCGTSAIPIESALHWTNCFTFGGDFHEKAIERTAANIDAVQSALKENKKSHLKLDAVQWNIHNFPLRDACVDVFISDLPFGHRLGSRSVNRTLYPSLLCEMARTARPGARACLLTGDRTSLIKAIQTYGKLWQRRLILNINIGGLSGFVFVLIRSTEAFQRACAAALSPTKSPGDNLAQSPENPSSPVIEAQSPDNSSPKVEAQRPESPSSSQEEISYPIEGNK